MNIKQHIKVYLVLFLRPLWQIHATSQYLLRQTPIRFRVKSNRAFHCAVTYSLVSERDKRSQVLVFVFILIYTITLRRMENFSVPVSNILYRRILCSFYLVKGLISEQPRTFYFGFSFSGIGVVKN